MAAFGVDAAFSYKYNQQRSVCDKDGLAMCPGFATTHVIPVCCLCYLLYLRILYVKKISFTHQFEDYYGCILTGIVKETVGGKISIRNC
jgi:hypothetical protein